MRWVYITSAPPTSLPASLRSNTVVESLCYRCQPQCTDSTSIRELTARYNANINALIRSTMGTGVLVDLCGLLKPWVAHSAITRKR